MVVFLFAVSIFLFSCNTNPVTKISYTFANADKGRELMSNHNEYFKNLTQCNLDLRLHKNGATLEEFKAFRQSQVLDYTDEEKKYIGDCIEFIENRLESLNCKLPFSDEIIFVKTTGMEETGAEAYTQKNEIYFTEKDLNDYYSESDNIEKFSELLVHEMFHCLSRKNPEFRKKMYNIIGFSILDKDIVLPDLISNRIFANPDVERIDNYAIFSINGQETKCELASVFLETFEEAQALEWETSNFFEHLGIRLIPINDEGVVEEGTVCYKIPEIDGGVDFFHAKVGKNTKYVIAPEECMADNFSYAVMYGQEGIDANKFESPEIIKSILTILNSDYALN